jgi:predicted NBD/HSP70 family sugar kinase
VDEAARALAAGIANFINILNPTRVVLTGGLCGLGAGYLETVTAEARARAFKVTAQHAEITFSTHGELTCAHGAACLAREARE